MKSKLIGVLILVGLSACRPDPIDNVGGSNPDWTEASHGNVAPNYSMVFPQDQVNELEITIGADQWSAIRNNMKSLFGYDFGAGGMGGPPGAFPTTEPDYVQTTVKFKGKTWQHVGFRLKGNSTLTSAWRSGIYKLPFRLDFDKFEDVQPSVKNQKFYGFKELSFSPGVKDNSLIREKLGSDIFRMAGIPSAQSAFYKVYIDFGAGMKYCGIYCGLELPDDKMIIQQLGEDAGNLYKPESKLATFVQTEFEKKNNELAGDFGDVSGLVKALQSTKRSSDVAAWRSGLEAVFNVDHFAKYLAINNSIVNWDTYGVMAHNYYLYNHSTKGLLWIPWDNNESFSKSPGITGTTGGPTGPGNAISLTMNEVGTGWPLINYIANDAVYFEKYKSHMRDFKNGIFTESTVGAMIDKYYDLITPFVVGTDGEQPKYTHLSSAAAFTAERSALKTHVSNRIALINQFLP
ncbi:MAG: CotH kinase family protein [Bacteroidia bacterium]|jgi:spore coat protein CotH|nr:spore coat protein CotH [Bacteroidota bacterium]